jgi:hypothetical protein
MGDKTGLIINGLCFILVILGIVIIALIASYRNNAESSSLSQHLTTILTIAEVYTIGFGALIYMYVLKHVDNVSEYMIIGQIVTLFISIFAITSATLNLMIAV